MEIKTIKLNEEVKIINGVFKGIYGIPNQIKMSVNENTLIYIEVDNMNTILVNMEDVEFLYDDYLIYKSEKDTYKPINIIGKYRLRKDKVEEFIQDIYLKSLKPCEMCKFCISAVQLNKLEFNFNGLSLSVEEIKNIII